MPTKKETIFESHLRRVFIFLSPIATRHSLLGLRRALLYCAFGVQWPRSPSQKRFGATREHNMHRLRINKHRLADRRSMSR